MVVLLLAVTTSALPAAAAPDPEAERSVSALTASFERDLGRFARRDRVPGAAAAIVRGGEVVWEGAAGTVDRESGAAVRSDTVFQVASLSKPVTALVSGPNFNPSSRPSAGCIRKEKIFEARSCPSTTATTCQ